MTLPNTIVGYRKHNGAFNLHELNRHIPTEKLFNTIREETPLGSSTGTEDIDTSCICKYLRENVTESEYESAGKAIDTLTQQTQRPLPVNPEPIQRDVDSTRVFDEVNQYTDSEETNVVLVDTDFTVVPYTIRDVVFDEHMYGYVGIRLVDSASDDQINTEERAVIHGAEQQIKTLLENNVILKRTAIKQFKQAIIQYFAENNTALLLPQSSIFSTERVTSTYTAFSSISSLQKYYDTEIPYQYGEHYEWETIEGLERPTAYHKIEDDINAFINDDLDSTVSTEWDTTEDNEHQQQQLTGFTMSEQSNTGNGSAAEFNTVLDSVTEAVLPSVSIELGISSPTDEGFITVDGNTVVIDSLPPRLQHFAQEYKTFRESLNVRETSVSECNECRERNDGFEYGYLTVSDNIDSYKNAYECGNTWEKHHTPTTRFVNETPDERWKVECEINDNDSVPLHVVENEVEYTFTVTNEILNNGSDGIDSTSSEVTVTKPCDTELSEDSEDECDQEFITGYTDGKQWQLVVMFKQGHIEYEWERTNGDGKPIGCVSKNNENDDNDHIVTDTIEQLNSNEDIDIANDDVELKPVSVSNDSRVREATCECTRDFTEVWPPDKYGEREINVFEIDENEVPNTPQHLSKIRSKATEIISEAELSRYVQLTLYCITELYGNETDSSDNENMSVIETI